MPEPVKKAGKCAHSATFENALKHENGTTYSTLSKHLNFLI